MNDLRGYRPLFVAWAVLGLAMTAALEVERAGVLRGAPEPLWQVGFWLATLVAALILWRSWLPRNRFGEVFLAVLLGSMYTAGIGLALWSGAVWLVQTCRN